MSKVRVEVENAAQIDRALRGVAHDCDDMAAAERESAQILARRARASAPRRTGRLAASVSASGRTATASASYAAYVEFGTRFRGPDPYWVPAIHSTEPAYVRVFDRELGKIAHRAERVTA
jgi:HK97 gp10 family phage protein